MLDHSDHHQIFADYVRTLPDEVQALNRPSARMPGQVGGRTRSVAFSMRPRNTSLSRTRGTNGMTTLGVPWRKSPENGMHLAVSAGEVRAGRAGAFLGWPSTCASGALSTSVPRVGESHGGLGGDGRCGA